jgi:hypothetical protein
MIKKLILMLFLVMGIATAQPPSFESSGTVQGYGYGQVQQVNPYYPAANYYYFGGWGYYDWNQWYYPFYNRYWYWR